MRVLIQCLFGHLLKVLWASTARVCSDAPAVNIKQFQNEDKLVCFSEEQLCDTGMGATLIVGTRPLLVASYSAMVTPLNGRLSSTVMLGLRIRSGFRIEPCQLDLGLVLPVVFFLVPDLFVRKLFRSRHEFIGRSRSPNMSVPSAISLPVYTLRKPTLGENVLRRVQRKVHLEQRVSNCGGGPLQPGFFMFPLHFVWIVGPLWLQVIGTWKRERKQRCIPHIFIFVTFGWWVFYIPILEGNNCKELKPYPRKTLAQTKRFRAIHDSSPVWGSMLATKGHDAFRRFTTNFAQWLEKLRNPKRTTSKRTWFERFERAAGRTTFIHFNARTLNYAYILKQT